MTTQPLIDRHGAWKKKFRLASGFISFSHSKESIGQTFTQHLMYPIKCRSH